MASKLLDYDRLDPELTPVLNLLPEEMSNITHDNIVALRETLAAQNQAAVPTQFKIEQHVVETPDCDVPVFVYRREPATPQAALIWIHGGGYILGSAEDDRARNETTSLRRLGLVHASFPSGVRDGTPDLEQPRLEVYVLPLQAEVIGERSSVSLTSDK